MVNQNSQKLSVFTRFSNKISAIKHDFIVKFNKFKIESVDDRKAVLHLIYEIIFYGFLLNLGLTVFNIPFTYLSFLSFGAGFWLLKEKIVPLIILPILNAFRLVMIYK